MRRGSALAAWLPTIALALATPASVAQEAWRIHLDAGDYAAATRAAAAVPDEGERARSLAEIRFQGRDFPGCLSAVAAGLEHDPHDLRLTWYGAAGALWSGDGELAASFVERMRSAFDAAGLSVEEREGWERTAGDFAQQAEELLLAEQARDAAVRRARITVLLAGTTAAAGLLFAGFRSGR